MAGCVDEGLFEVIWQGRGDTSDRNGLGPLQYIYLANIHASVLSYIDL